MRKRFLSFVFAICLIIPCLFMFTGCKEENTNQLQLNVKYYAEYSASGSYNVYYYIFTETECTEYKLDIYQENSEPSISTYLYSYVDDETVCLIKNYSNEQKTFLTRILLVSENFVMEQDGDVFVAENYLVNNNLRYIKE